MEVIEEGIDLSKLKEINVQKVITDIGISNKDENGKEIDPEFKDKIF